MLHVTTGCYMLRVAEAWSERGDPGCAHSLLVERFAHTVVAAVQAAVRYHWSQGPIEGHIHRLKLLKRQMYCCAKLDLLRQRVLFHIAS